MTPMPRVVKPRTTPVPMPKRTPAGEPAVRRYNPKLEPGIKTKARPGQSGPKKKSPSLGRKVIKQVGKAAISPIIAAGAYANLTAKPYKIIKKQLESNRIVKRAPKRRMSGK